MKIIPSIIISVILFSCNESPPFAFEEIACKKTEAPEFDGQIVSLLDNETGQAVKDTLIEKIPKTRNVFQPCRQYIYNAIYRDQNDNLISESHVWMMATGERWEFQPEKQDKVAIQYEVIENEISEIKKHFVNKKWVSQIQFTTQETTGIIENVQEVWMHPFRANQFNFTEVAAFPAVKFPLEVGKTWTSNLVIGEGWGDWEHSTIYSTYKVVDKTKLQTEFKTFEDCWKVESKSTAPFGDSQHIFWFDERYGFVKMEYTNYQGQTLIFELKNVLEK
ncbi:MAG: hypothetical protein M3512_11370 [Bacteroidota bacterium]|nr:hypothetical protein [Bacteroidota bacterium]